MVNMQNTKDELIEALLSYGVHDKSTASALTKAELLDLISELAEGEEPSQDTEEDVQDSGPSSPTVRIAGMEIDPLTGESREVQEEPEEKEKSDKSGYIQALPTNREGFTPFVKMAAHSLFYNPKKLPYQQQQIAQLLDLFFDLTAYPEPRNRAWNSPMLPVAVKPDWVKFVAMNTGFILRTSQLLRDSEDFRQELIALLKKYSR